MSTEEFTEFMTEIRTVVAQSYGTDLDPNELLHGGNARPVKGTILEDILVVIDNAFRKIPIQVHAVGKAALPLGDPTD